jgi:putative DNA primase/helicase
MTLIKDKTQLNTTAMEFLDLLFAKTLDNDDGQIELKLIKNGAIRSTFHSNYEQIPDLAYQGCNDGWNVYFGVNPRVGGAGKKENVHYLTCFHAEVDYGVIGHKKKPEHSTYEEALEVIRSYDLKPTVINHSGGGFHCYWILNNYISVEKHGVETLESINKGLSRDIKADPGTHDLVRVLRIPGTFNQKLSGNPRKVTVITMAGPRYKLEDFERFLKPEKPAELREENKPDTSTSVTWDDDIKSLKISDKMKKLIMNGNDGTYISRSEAEMAVLLSLIHNGYEKTQIQAIFSKYPIGEKYKEQKSPGQYLEYNISKAKEHSNWTEEEFQDPLFISGSITKDMNNKYGFNVLKFEEYIAKKFWIKYLEKEKTFFRFNGQCYQQYSNDLLNNLCSQELGKHREFYSKSAQANFIHYCIGDCLIDSDKAFNDQKRYLTLKNGLFDLNDQVLIPHTPEIFTANPLPYDFDPGASCDLWVKFLEDVLLGDQSTITFVQQAVGYCFLKEILTPALFLLIGEGSNGKSVFVNTIQNLFGNENVSNISLNQLSNEYYTLKLFGKMVNLSSETPHKKQINTDLVKAAVAGDWISGRLPYEPPTSFKPYAKHFLSMNTVPKIDDLSHGWDRRIYPIDFKKTFTKKEMDVHLTNKLAKELSGIFNWALEGYRNLRDMEYEFIESASIDKAKENYKTQSNSVFNFINEKLAKGKQNDVVMMKNLYDAYKDFCNSEGEKIILTKSEFKKVLKADGYTVDNSSRHNNSVCVFNVTCN